jgi:hypothetical protein
MTTRSDYDPVLTFDDVPQYAYVRHRGRKAYVTAKGPKVRTDTDGRHLQLQYMDGGADGSPHQELHENLVEKYLEEKKHLWVDFTHSFRPNESQ